MSILWLDSFDYYGTNKANLGTRGYNETGFGYPAIISNPSQARTGSGCISMDLGSAPCGFNRVLNTAVNVCGAGVGILFPVNQDGDAGPALTFGITGSATHIRIIGNANNGFTVRQEGVVIGTTANNLFVQNTYYWLEAKIITGNQDASIELRFGGVTVLVITGLTINPIVNCGFTRNFTNIIARLDDFVIWDGAGTTNNDFLGDRRIVTLYPNADTVEADWTPSSGSVGFQLINETVPNDSGFITANNVGDISEFDKQPIPLDVNTVAAICPVARAFKDSAGPSTFRIGINSAGNVENSAVYLPNTTISYFSPIFELNPNGNVPWTRTALDAATVRLTREG